MINLLNSIKSSYYLYEGKEFKEVSKRTEELKEELKKLIIIGKQLPSPRIIEKAIEELQNIGDTMEVINRKTRNEL